MPSFFYNKRVFIPCDWDELRSKMIACTRCGRWHTDPEEVFGRRLSCTEVRRYWSRIRKEHIRLYEHVVQITTEDSGKWICFKCKRGL
jgi:hypothetical protein